MADPEVDESKRGFLVAATRSWAASSPESPQCRSSRACALRSARKAAGAPVEVDISSSRPGEMIVEWRGKPVWIVAARRKC